MSDSDEVLIKQYAGGDALAFESLYHRHRDSLFRFVLRQVDNQQQQAEEIFQDVWGSVINSCQQFKQQSSFKTWLYQLARHRIIDYVRKNKIRSVDVDQHEVVESRDDKTPGIEHQILLDNCIELIKSYVQKLPGEQREAFLLKHEAEHSLDVIAEITSSTRETIKSRLRYAMQKLRALMPEECL